MSLSISGTDGILFPDSTVMESAVQAATAWINFDGTGTIAITDSFNISSITDNALGNYDITFATAMADGDYCMVAASSPINNSASACPFLDTSTTPSTTVTTVHCLYANQTVAGAYDPDYVYLAFFGGQ